MADQQAASQQQQPTMKPAAHSRQGSSGSPLSPTSSSSAAARRSPVIRPQAISTSAISSASTTPLQTPRKDGSLAPSPSVSKRSSYAENLNLRQYPSSPRQQRTHSFSGPALAELLMHPSSKTSHADERFKGRDWRQIQVGEIIDPQETRFVELDTSIEDTTKLLVRSGAPNVVLVRESTKTKTAIGTFDFSNLNAYLLLVLGMIQPDDQAAKVAERARTGDGDIPLRDIQNHLGPQEEPMFLPHTALLPQAIEVLGGGHHRVVINKDGTTEAVGVLSQLRLVRFFWDNHQNFAATEKLYQMSLKELDLGTKEVLSINGDKPLVDALRLMHTEGITSLPVLDQNRNVVGNISHVDVRLLTDTSAIALLGGTCIHFIGVILSERGMMDGKDSYPVFHITPYSTLAHTVAKLCATRSHRMWIVEGASPSTSVPPSPGPHAAVPPVGLHASSPNIQHHSPITTASSQRSGSITEAQFTPGPPYTSMQPGVSVSAGSIPGAVMSGRLTGVVSLTDILNLFARASGLHPQDPEETRRRRRQSSSSSIRPSIDSVRPSIDNLRQSMDMSKSGELARSSSKSSDRSKERSSK